MAEIWMQFKQLRPHYSYSYLLPFVRFVAAMVRQNQVARRSPRLKQRSGVVTAEKGGSDQDNNRHHQEGARYVVQSSASGTESTYIISL